MESKAIWDRRPGVILFLIAAAGAAVRLAGIGRDGLWFDELQTVWASRLSWEHFLTGMSSWSDVPVYYLAGRFWFSIHTGEAWTRLLACAAGVALIVIVYLLGRELFSRRAGLWAAAFTAASPFLAWACPAGGGAGHPPERDFRLQGRAVRSPSLAALCHRRKRVAPWLGGRRVHGVTASLGVSA